MSNRSLVELNHDFAHNLCGDFVNVLHRYLCSASRSDAEALERFGVKVIGMRHHSGSFYVENEPEGFPVKIFPAKPRAVGGGDGVPVHTGLPEDVPALALQEPKP